MGTVSWPSELRMARRYVEDIVWLTLNKGMAAASSAKDFPLLFVGILIGLIGAIFIGRSHTKHTTAKAEQLQQTTSKTEVDASPTEKKEKETVEYSTYIVLDVEGTCEPGKGFDYPNEIIEWPVVLMRWAKKKDGSKKLVVVDEFHSFVRPTFQPTLHPFCKELTGVTQEQVDNSPTFPVVLERCKQFLIKHGVLDPQGKPLENYAWCTDGPWDLRDFYHKQAYISRIKRPSWLPTRVLDVRQAFGEWYAEKYLGKYAKGPRRHGTFSINPSYRLTKQLSLLGMEFQGREHSGMDDSRNIARVLAELSVRGVHLRPNLDVTSTRQFSWMGPNGTVIHNF